MGVLAVVGLGFRADRFQSRSPRSRAAIGSAVPIPRPAAPVSLRRSVAVLGFDNLAGRPDVDYLGAALLQMLPTELGRTGRLRLVPAENVARARTDLSLTRSAALGPATLSRVRSYLGADLAIGGSYLVTGPEGRTRFDVQMQDTRTGETLATLSESKALSDYTLQRKAALAVVRKGRALDARVLIAEGRFQEGYAALNQGEPAAAKAALDDAAELFEGAGDRGKLARTWTVRGIYFEKQGDMAAARAAYQRSGEIYRQIGNEYGAAGSLNNLAVLAIQQGRLKEGRQRLQEALAVFRRLDRKTAAASALNNLGAIAQLQGDLDQYEARLREVLAVYRDIGDRGGEARTLVNRGSLHFSRGDLDGAGKDFAEALRIFEHRRQERHRRGSAGSWRCAAALRPAGRGGAALQLRPYDPQGAERQSGDG